MVTTGVVLKIILKKFLPDTKGDRGIPSKYIGKVVDVGGVNMV